jgi:hypothetical protein
MSNIRCSFCYFGQNERCKILECPLKDVPQMDNCTAFMKIPETNDCGYGEI